MDQSVAGVDAKTALNGDGLIDQLKKTLAERALNAKMDHHLTSEGTSGNRRNGYGNKTVLTDDGPLELSIPRSWQSSYDPQLVAKYHQRLSGFNDKIISIYARGMSPREIVGQVPELHGTDVPSDLTLAVTDAVLDAIAAGYGKVAAEHRYAAYP